MYLLIKYVNRNTQCSATMKKINRSEDDHDGLLKKDPLVVNDAIAKFVVICTSRKWH